MKKILSYGVLFLSLNLFAGNPDYAVVTDRETLSQPEWRKVADALVHKHTASLIVYDSAVEECVPALRKQFPKYICFLTRPECAGTRFVVRTNRLIRTLDSDPYADAVHAIMTGYDAAAALRTALADEPKVASTALLSCGVGPDRFKEAAFISDGGRGIYGYKHPDGKIETFTDTSNKALFFSNVIETLAPDVIMTSSHGSQYNIEMPFSEGSIVGKNGKVWRQRGKEALIDYKTGQSKKITLDNDRLVLIDPPKKPNVFFAFGNCLTGDIPRADCIALDAMAHLKSSQFIGYCFTTWYGLQGHLALRYWEQGGGYTPLNESHFFANQILLSRLEKLLPEAVGFNFEADTLIRNMKFSTLSNQLSPMLAKIPENRRVDLIGMVWDRDCVAFFGDPALSVYLDKDNTVKPNLLTALSQDKNQYTFTLYAQNEVGVPDQWTSPKAMLFEKRLKNIKLISGGEFEPVITDNFILVNTPGPVKKGESIRIVFTADPIE